MSEIKVKPVREILNDKGAIWEGELFTRGWNELPEKEKYGVIKGRFTIRGRYDVVDVYWNGIDYLSKNIFEDEITKIGI